MPHAIPALLPWLRRTLDERGTVAVEFALLVPILMLLLVASADFGMAFREKMQAEKAARAGLQYAIYDPKDNAGISSAILLATGLTAGDLSVTVSRFYECANGTRPAKPGFCAAGDWPGTYVRIEITKPFTTIMTWGGLTEQFTIRGSAEGRVQ
ncbi:MAG: TadE/TadG family type IV pilus assembly protein [Rhodospirillaceae bacterium]